MLEFREVQYYHLKVKLHRPTPRLRVRTPHDRQICLNAGQILIEDYLKQTRNGKLFYPWHGVQILFEAAIVLLDVCWSSRGLPLFRAQASRVLSVSLPDCISLLAQIGERWGESSFCAEYLQRIVRDVSKALHSQSTDGTENMADLLLTEKIKGLLFSDGPLSWDTASSDSGGCDRKSQNFFDDFPLPLSINNLDWHPSWELVDTEHM